MKILTTLALAALGAASFAQTHSRGAAAVYPWAFDHGTDTARATALQSLGEIAGKASYSLIPQQVAQKAWSATGYPAPVYGDRPSKSELAAYGEKVHARVVVFGSISWHTRSIWVGAGPKTISTATVNAYVYDVRAGKIVYKRAGVEARSDEKENGYKIAADVLVTPIVSAVSGGPATPREQKAVQLALGNALHDWAHPRG